MINSQQRSAIAYSVIGVLTLVSHGILLFFDGVFDDDWHFLMGSQRGDMDFWVELFGYAGNPPHVGALHYSISLLPNPVGAYRFFTFAIIALSALMIYRIGVESKLITPWQSLMIASFAIVYPAYQNYVSIMMFTSHVAYCLFFLAVLTFLRGDRAGGRRGFVLQEFGILCFLLCFAVASFLAFYGVFLLLLALYKLNQHDWRYMLRRFVPRYIWLGLLPPIYWFITRALYPVRAPGYNVITSDNLRLLLVERTFEVIFIFVYNRAVEALSNTGGVAITLALVCLFLWLIWTTRRSQVIFQPPQRTLILFGFGAISLALGLLPYWAVGKAPAPSGQENRHSLLTTLPIALMLTSFFYLIFFSTKYRLSKTIGTLTFCATITILSLVSINTYFDWQGIAAKDLAFQQDIVTAEDEMSDYSILWVDDLRSQPHRWNIAWTHMINHVLNTGRYYSNSLNTPLGLAGGFAKPHLIAPEDDFDVFQYVISPFLEGYDPRGCQAMLVVEEPPNSPSNVHLGREYLYRKLFDRSSREAFLEDLSSLNVLPMPSFQASNCANATLHEPIVFYPRTSEMVNYGNFLDLVLPRLTSGEISAQEQLVLSNLAFENHLAQAGIDAAAIAEWRQSKEPQYLEQAGIDYLFFDLQWTGWLSEQEYQLMLGEDSPYEIAARWVHPARETVYYLLQVPQKAQSQLNPVP